jgi:hypothetical protein
MAGEQRAMRYIDGRPKSSGGEGLSAEATGKSRYNACYNRLYPLLKGGRLDFTLLAEKTGFKERRIRETLWFRLGAGEVRQLFGLREHVCYLCNKPVPVPKEPLCLVCLEGIDELSRGGNFHAFHAEEISTDPAFPVLLDSEPLFFPDDEGLEETDADESLFAEGSTLLPPRRYGFEHVRPARQP